MPGKDTRRQKLIDFTVYFAARLVVCIIQATPIETCQRIARMLANLLAKRQTVRNKVVAENLSHAYPDWTQKQKATLNRQMWENLILMVCEIAHAPRKIHETNWRKYVTIENRRELVNALTDNRPLVLVTGHYGNFEIGGYIGGLLGFPSYTVQRSLDNQYLAEYLNRFRESKGQYTLPKFGSAMMIDKVLSRKETIVLLGDQHAGNHGCWVDFMGRPASCHKALALFTLTGGAPMLVTYTRRNDQPMNFTIGVEGIADPDCLNEEQQGVRQMTQWYSDCIERIVRDEPSQYWWLHRRWREKSVRHRRKKLPQAA